MPCHVAFHVSYNCLKNILCDIFVILSTSYSKLHSFIFLVGFLVIK